MAIVTNLDVLAEWAKENICSKVLLKAPDDDANDENYAFKLVHPEAFTLYVPSKDVSLTYPTPSICVQLLGGADKQNRGSMDVRFCFAVWNPGQHLDDLVNGETTEKDYFKLNNDGWRDLWNFIDVALSVVESTETIKTMRIVKEKDIEYGLFKDNNGVILDYFPYWHGWVRFSVEYGIIRNRKQVDEFL